LTFEQARQHSLAQLRLMVEAAERRDARRAIVLMNCMASAIALCLGQDKPAERLTKILSRIGRIEK